MRGLGGIASALVGALVLWTAAAPGPALAGAFTLEPGETKLFLTGVATSGDHYFDAAGKRRSRGRYRKDDVQLYGEYGARDGLTVFGAGGLQRVVATDERKGLGRSEFGVRARLFQRDGWIGSVQASGVLAGAEESATLAVIGETDDQADARFLIARSFEAFGRPCFLDLAAGYRVRGGDPADELRFDATLGVRAAPRWLLLAQSFNTIGTARWSGPYDLKQRIYKLQGSALFDLTETVSLIGAAFFTPAGRDALDERGATVGLGLRF